MITVSVKLFAGAREIVGTGALQLSLAEGACAGAILDMLSGQYPKLAAWKPYLKLAVNHEYSTPERPLNDRDEVAVIPPVSGG